MIRLKIILQSNFIYWILILFLFIYVFVFTKIISYESLYNGDESEISGKIKSVEKTNYGYKLELSAKEKVVVYFATTENYNYKDLFGKTVMFSGTLDIPKNNTIPNQFNYKEYLYNNKIHYVFSASNISFLSDGISFIDKIKIIIYEHISNFKSSDYLKMFILGDKSYISQEIYNRYQENGIAHLLAISGLHISLFLSIIGKILYKLENKYKYLIMILFLIFYLILTSFLVSVVRCFLFFLLKIISDKLSLNLSKTKILFFTAFIVLIINPFYVYDVGFLYTFVITFSLISLKNVNILNITIFSFLASLPITVNMVYEINVFSIFFNFVFVPFVSLIFYPLALLTVFINYLDNFLYFIIILFENMNIIGNKYFLCMINIPKMNILLVFLYYLILYLSITKNYKYIYYLIIVLLLNENINKLNPKYDIYFIDIGQGDSTILISPFQKEIIIIDTGGSIYYDLTSNIVLFLKSLGIKQIDILVLSHGDYDHIGNAVKLSEEIEIKSVMFNKNEFNEEEMRIFELNINVTDYVNLDYFYGYNINNHISSNENDSSIVLNLYMNGIYILFTGDISVDILDVIINKYNINTNILKVSHHGSKDGTNKSVVDKLNFDYAIISVGVNNFYGHPNKEVLEALEGKKIYQTSINGTINLEIDQKVYNFSLYEP